MPWEYFSDDEMRCHCGCKRVEMDPYFMSKLHSLRKLLEFPFLVTSGFRCPEYNEKISSTGTNGPHTTGRAVDIAISGKQAYLLVQYAANFHFLGIGIKQSGPDEKRYVHLDDLSEKEGFPRPRIWSY
ncbi:MAG: DUF882 domain-containing protein [Proteobacteria bacterium]|nr:DUF882 domain-containing protein [Pseudomonadota bacterium]